MTTKQILSLTLLATTLTLNAAVPKELFATTKQRANSISNAVASILYRKGIEEDKALELSKAIITADEELFSIMLHNLLNSTGLRKEAVLEYLSKQALMKKSVDLSSYSFLVKLSQSVKNTTLQSQELDLLGDISRKNELICKVFS